MNIAKLESKINEFSVWIFIIAVTAVFFTTETDYRYMVAIKLAPYFSSTGKGNQPIVTSREAIVSNYLDRNPSLYAPSLNTLLAMSHSSILSISELKEGSTEERKSNKAVIKSNRNDTLGEREHETSDLAEGIKSNEENIGDDTDLDSAALNAPAAPGNFEAGITN